MAVTRPNILKNATARQKYTQGVNLLKNDFPGPTTKSLGIKGTDNQISSYDLFVIWHQTAMMTMTPKGQKIRNAAHSGPAFLPWHRFMLRQLELNLRRVLGDNNFGLPYWDWADDGQLSSAQQKQSKIWAADCMGGSGTPVTTGPFAYDPNNPNSFRVRFKATALNQFVQVNRGLKRSLGTGYPNQGPVDLPTKADTTGVLGLSPYDGSNWDQLSAGFRVTLEGWQGPGLHNLVHVWVGGDMWPGTSPNDPVFFLNHCNVDRIWEAWMQPPPQGNGRVYLPPDSAPVALKGHRLNDDLLAFISPPTKPSAVLDMTADYVYDSLAV